MAHATDPSPASISVTKDLSVEHKLEYSEDYSRVRRLVDGEPQATEFATADEGWVDATKHYIDPVRHQVEELTGRPHDELWAEWQKDHPRDQWTVQDFIDARKARELADA